MQSLKRQSDEPTWLTMAAEYMDAYQKLSPSEQAEKDRLYKRREQQRWLLRKVLPFTLLGGWLAYDLLTKPDATVMEGMMFFPMLGLIWLLIEAVESSL